MSRSPLAALFALLLSLAPLACRGTDEVPAGNGATSAATGGGGSGGGGEGGAPVDPGPPCSPDVPRAVPIQLFVGPDTGEAPFADALAAAETSIDVMVYLMGYGKVLDTLEQKAQEGLPVRVILDGSQLDTNQKYFDMLTAAGVEVRWSDPQFKYMHAKVILVDGAVAVVSSGNYSQWQIASERNFVTRDEDPDDVATLAAIFEADWQKTPPDVSCTRLLVSPVNARQRLLDFIAGATSTLDIESMQFADDEVRSAVAARRAAGVQVRALLADPGWIDANADAAAFLAANDIPARYLVDPSVHAKALIADGKRALTGSLNLSWTSLTKNREVSLVVDEADGVKSMADTFEKDWAAATPF